MNKDKTRRKTWMEDFLGDIKLSRRSFIKASAATGAAVAVGSGLKPELKALAAAAPSGAGEMGQWMPVHLPGVHLMVF